MIRTLLVAMLVSSLALAGCTSNDDNPEPITTPTSNQGIIEGLIVDERYRPLEIGPEGVSGFLLIQETGAELKSNANGEFFSAPLDPGTYTVRAQAEGFEITPVKVTIRANEFSQAVVQARRIVSLEDVMIQQEFAVFIPCMMGLVVTPFGACALMDLSGDTARYVFRMNTTAYPELRILVNELLLNKDAGSLRDGTYMMQIEGPNPENPVQSYNYVSKFIESGNYDKTILVRGEQNEFQQDPLLSHGVWDGGDWIGWRFWGQGLMRKDLNDAGVPVSYGVGPQVAMKARVLTSLLFSDDIAEAEAVCGLC